MALPALTKTWEFMTNQATVGATNASSNNEVAFKIKNLLTDTIANGYQDASFVDIGGGTFAIQGITDDTVDGSMVGKTLKVRGSTSPGNDGDFTITSVPSSSEVRYSNGSGVAEPVDGSWNILGGNFTTPWVMQHSYNPFHGPIGVRDDGVDRIGVASDNNVSFSSGGYWVVKNTVTGTEWVWGGTRQNSGDNAAIVGQTTYPNYFDEWGGAGDPIAAPNTITDLDGTRTSQIWFRYKADWITNTGSAFVAKVHVMMSDDGQNTRVLVSQFGVFPLLWVDETVLNPHPDWIANGNSTVACMRNSAATSNIANYGTFNDSTGVYASELPDSLLALLPQTSGTDLALVRYLTCGGAQTACLRDKPCQTIPADSFLSSTTLCFPGTGPCRRCREE